MSETVRPHSIGRASSVLRAFVAFAAFAGIVLVVLVQCALVWRVANGQVAFDPLLPVVAINLIGGALQALLFRALLPQHYREPRGWSLLLLWLGCAFVPLFGGLVVLVSCAWAACYPRSHSGEELDDVPAPEFVTHLMSRVSHGGGARLQARIVNTQVNASDRLSALVAIQSMPTRTTGTLLRELLADPVEDVRLIAYGTLDQAENEVTQRIFQTGQSLETASTDDQRHAINRQLAELYFELIYQNLVQGAVYRHTLEQADRHARAALEAASLSRTAPRTKRPTTWRVPRRWAFHGSVWCRGLPKSNSCAGILRAYPNCWRRSAMPRRCRCSNLSRVTGQHETLTAAPRRGRRCLPATRRHVPLCARRRIELGQRHDPLVSGVALFDRVRRQPRRRLRRRGVCAAG
jgi:hypothetical protein